MAGIGKACGDYYRELPKGMMMDAVQSFGVRFLKEAVITLWSGKKLQVEIKSIVLAGAVSGGISLLDSLLKPAFKKLFPVNYIPNTTPASANVPRNLVRILMVQTVSSLLEAKYLKNPASIRGIALHSFGLLALIGLKSNGTFRE